MLLRHVSASENTHTRRVQFHKEVRVVKSVESSLLNGKWYILSNPIILSIGDAYKLAL